MAKSILTVTLPDGTTATRTSTHPYTHCLIVLLDRGAESKWAVTSWHASPRLADKALTAALKWKNREAVERRIVPVTERRAIATRVRVRCNGITLQACTWIREPDMPPVWCTLRCLKDAVAGTDYCARHEGQANPAVREMIAAEARASEQAYHEASQAKWQARHAEEATAETCRVHECPVHRQDPGIAQALADFAKSARVED